MQKKQRTSKMSGKKFRVKFNCESRVEGGLSVQRGDIVLEEVTITILNLMIFFIQKKEKKLFVHFIRFKIIFIRKFNLSIILYFSKFIFHYYFKYMIIISFHFNGKTFSKYFYKTKKKKIEKFYVQFSFQSISSIRFKQFLTTELFL